MQTVRPPHQHSGTGLCRIRHGETRRVLDTSQTWFAKKGPMHTRTSSSHPSMCRSQVFQDNPGAVTMDPSSNHADPQMPLVLPEYHATNEPSGSGPVGREEQDWEEHMYSNGNRGLSTLSVHAPFPSLGNTEDRPYMLYIPDLDGQGLTSKRQWSALAAAFDFHVLTIAAEDRSSLEDMIAFTKSHLEMELRDLAPERPAYLMAEGFGALVAIHAAAQCSDKVSRVLLVNPATSFMGSPLAQIGPVLARLPPALYQAAPFALAPILGNPFRMAAALGGSRLNLPDPAALAQGLQEVLPQLQQLQSLPPDTVQWRLKLMAQHSQDALALLRRVEARVMVLLGGQDRVLPNEKHVKTLEEQMTRGFVKVLPEGGHAVLAEAGCDVVALMKEAGFYITKRRFTSAVSDASDIHRYGYAGPVELPTQEEVKRVAGAWNGQIRQLSSPVFFSTLPDGRVVEGLDGIPDDKPLLIVGNHQVFAFDMYVMVEELMLKRGLLVRGLAHPGVFQDTSGRSGADRDNRILPDVLSNTYKTFGAVPVTPQNFYRLLQRKEAVLLYPGGVREGFKRKYEQYQLFWPTRSEFVRMAAKCGATIVPVSSIGVDDGLEILLDTDEIAASPWLGPGAKEAAAAMPVPRVGVSEDDGLDQTFIPPLFVPRVPKRFYFHFHQAVRLDKSMANDKAACDKVYGEVKGMVEGGLRWLLLKRESDPYKDFLPRFMYENAPGKERRVAPTFKP